MNVGDTFVFEGTEYSIKKIDMNKSLKFPTGRVDASKFVGEGFDRRVQRGRPKMLHFKDVEDIFGPSEPTPTPDVEVPGDVKEEWSKVRRTTPIDGESLLTSLPDSASSSDW